MKIHSHAPVMATFPREGAKPPHAGRAGKPGPEMAASVAAPPEAAKGAPPGLQRVLARLEAMGEAGRTTGQNQAMDRIARNIARYQENQAIAPLPPAPAPEAGETVPADEDVVEAPDTAETPDEAGEAAA